MTKKIIYLIIAMTFIVLPVNAFANTSVLTTDQENSWRYENGQHIVTDKENIVPDSISLFSTATPWSKTDSGFVNNTGAIIQGANKKGIDVSSHQGTIDWNKVKNTDIDYAIIRCGYGDNYTQYDDSQWFNNANACTALDIPFGVYIYSYARSIDEAQSEAEHVLRLINGYKISYPIYLDLEDNDLADLGAEMLGDIAETFCNIIQGNGYDVGIYANKNWWTTKLTDSAFSNDSWYKWVAQYNSECTYSGSYTMWQATSTGSVDGISGNVDINFWFGNDSQTDNTTDYSYPNTYINTGNLRNDIVGIAQTQIGYTELSADGLPIIDSETPQYTKYGAHYGNSYGHWCAFFVMWCADQANIPTSIICQSVSCGNCNYFTEWFKSNERWKDNSYIPQRGDIIFFDWTGDGKANHVGVVVEADENTVTTIEGNTGGVNGYLVAQNVRNSDILGYGVPDYDLQSKINGYATSTQTAYMLPDSNSNTVWETWINDELQVLCEDGDYYLVLYPYVYTGKFVAAYVPKNTVAITGSVPVASEFYNMNKAGKIITVATVYHNASTDDLMSGAVNYKERSTLDVGSEVEVLFEDNGFYFIRNDSISGYVLKEVISLLNNDTTVALPGDVNNDKNVDSADAGLILRYDVGLIDFTEDQISVSDITKDGTVDSADAGIILRYDAGLLQALK